MGIRFLLNREAFELDRPPSMRVLDLLRDELGLTATKAGCREGDCGACSILLGTLRDGSMAYRLVNSCLLPLGAVAGHHLVTLEGLNGSEPTPIQQALVEEGGVQCGFCTPGVVMALTAHLLNAVRLDQDAAVEALDGNLCRCTGYMGIKRAAARLHDRYAERLPPVGTRMAFLIQEGLLPDYFSDIPGRLQAIPRPQTPPAAHPIAVAGGTDLFTHVDARLETATLRFLGEEAGWQGIRIEEGMCHIGAATTVEALLESPLLAEHLPHWHQHLARIASTPVRDRATIGGNLVNASPIGDLSILLLALDSTLVLQQGEAQRRLPLAAFFHGYKQIALHEDELLREIVFPLAPEPLLVNFEKVALRDYLDIATVNTATALERRGDGIGAVRLAAGGVGPTPLLLTQTAAILQQGPLDRERLQQALDMAMEEVSPIDDVHGSAAYKRLLLRRLILAHLLELVPELLPQPLPPELLEVE